MQLSNIAFFGFSFLLPVISAADSGTTLDNVRIRAAAEPEAAVVGRLSRGASISVKAYGEDWLEILAGRYQGRFVAKRLVAVKESEETAEADPSQAAGQPVVTLETVRVRGGAGLNAPVVGRLPKGTAVKVKILGDEWAEILEGAYHGRFVAKHLVLAQMPSVADGRDANRELAESLAAGYVAEGRVDAAEQYLRNHLAKDPKHAKGFALLGKAQAEQGKWEDARSSYHAASELTEGKEQALYFHAIADTYAREGDVAAAQESLSRAERSLASVSTASADQVARMRNLVRAGSPLPALDLSVAEGRPAERKITGSAAVKAGYDSNVLLQADDANAANSSGSALITPSAKIAYATPFLGGQLSAASFTSFTAYAKEAVRTSNNLYESLSAEWAPEAREDRFLDPVFGNRVDLSLVNSSGLEFYSVANTVYFGAAKKLNEQDTLIFELPVGYQQFAKKLSLANAADNRSGFLLTPSLMLSHRAGSWTVNGGASYSEVFSLGDNYQARGFTLLAGASRSLFWELSGRLSLAYTRNSYYRNPLNRRDNRYDLSLNLSRVLPFDPNLSASFEYLLMRNDSSLASARYTRGASLIQVNYGF